MTDHSVLCSSQDHLRTRIHDLDHTILAGAKNTDNYPSNNLLLGHHEGECKATPL
jgi:hypothetical protein